jgi:beta-aspartyl-peptidase (threonine type)
MLLISLCLLILSYVNSNQIQEKFVIAVHGGAGGYNRTLLTKEKEQNIKQGLLDALRAGVNSLNHKGSHLDSAQEVLISMENNPLFNAGRGAKINRNFEVELDASIMDGSNLNCGAIGGSKRIKNPIKGARLVMEKTPHIFIISQDVDRFAEENKLEIVPNYYFFTLDRIKEWFEAKEKSVNQISKKGTIGAVVLDKRNNIAAATSTGGTTYKMAGRIGDTPILGAGNYANNLSVGVSCTGTGEIMMKNLLAYDVHARMYYKNITLKKATEEIFDHLENDAGGFIAVDKDGNVEMPYNTSGMARGYVREDGKAYIYIFNEEDDITPILYDI